MKRPCYRLKQILIYEIRYGKIKKIIVPAHWQRKELQILPEKKYEDMTEHELLVELLRSQKQEARSRKISAIVNTALLALLLGCALIALPRLQALAVQAGDTLSDLQLTITQAQQSLRAIDSLANDVDQLVGDNTEAVSQSLQKLSEVDLDGLNAAIKNLSQILQPMADF